MTMSSTGSGRWRSESSAVRAAGRRLEPGSPEETALWADDLLGDSLLVGERIVVKVPAPGQWDARAVDKDGRTQHVSSLKLLPGGKYILELNDGGWRLPRL
jgi:hypothetical protein